MNDNNNITNEDKDLSGFAPELSKLKAGNTSGPSDSYFESFNVKLKNSIEGIEEIEQFAPTLLNIPKYNPFDIPKDYFDELPSLVQQKAATTNRRTDFIEWLLLFIKPRFVIPLATTIIIAVAGINYMNRNSEIIYPAATEELSLEDHIYYIDEAAIIEQYAADTETENENTLSEDNTIEDYLIDNDIEETDL
jgi:hypothetical protein